MSDIRFYKVNDEYGNFSNFAPFLIFLDGESWPTVEHFFQASKFEDSMLKDRIKSLASPMQAAIEGRKKSHPLIPNWESIKEEVMLKALYAKFCQHPLLRKELLMTGVNRIVEHTDNDSYWGDGGDGSGKNRLGILLMTVRSSLRELNEDPEIVLPPWLAFPGTVQSDMFWRMGIGENYMYQWSRYYLSLIDQLSYRQSFPVPDKWQDFFD